MWIGLVVCGGCVRVRILVFDKETSLSVFRGLEVFDVYVELVKGFWS